MIFFSGLDFVGYNLTGSTTVLGFDHIERWIGDYQYSGNTTQLFWVYNQSIYSWLLTIMILSQKNKKNIVFIWANAILTSTFSFVGLLPYVVVGLIQGLRKNSLHIKEIFSIQNILGGVIGIISYLFITGNQNSMNLGILENSSNSHLTMLFMIVVFIGIEVMPYMLLCYATEHKNLVYWATCISLVLIPFVSIRDNYANDFCLRVSIPALFVLMVLVIKRLYEKKRKYQYIITITLLVIGAITSVHEIKRTLMNTNSSYSNITLPRQRLFESCNYTSDMEGWIWRTIFKKTENDEEFRDILIYNLAGYTGDDYGQGEMDGQQIMTISETVGLHIGDKIENDLLLELSYHCTEDLSANISVSVNGNYVGVIENNDMHIGFLKLPYKFWNLESNDNVIILEVNKNGVILDWIKLSNI